MVPVHRCFFMDNVRPADIYVIDDQPIDSMILRLLFKKFDPDLLIEAISNAYTALERLKAIANSEPFFLPDYIFLDLDMPEMDGWQFLKEYERLGISQFKSIQIYVLSSSLYQNDIQKSLLNPLVQDFISKPLSLQHIKEIFQPA
ncbi:response regulator [Mucilaginibacter conchicola]|uniref:Response regulator n=2 Tax=Mucilaginibacter conchicola TaxID=2303333 RepID=A0A372NM10_9SPHI|nr:response regulator [Mucilaginibacter conchicola]